MNDGHGGSLYWFYLLWASSLICIKDWDEILPSHCFALEKIVPIIPDLIHTLYNNFYTQNVPFGRTLISKLDNKLYRTINIILHSFITFLEKKIGTSFIFALHEFTSMPVWYFNKNFWIIALIHTKGIEILGWNCF